jgi:DNA-directed RNA polymerase alpha subunit
VSDYYDRKAADRYGLSIEHLEVGARVRRALLNEGISHVGPLYLLSQREMLRFPGMWKASVAELERALSVLRAGWR